MLGLKDEFQNLRLGRSMALVLHIGEAEECMNTLRLAAVAMTLTATLTACSGNTPTAPSTTPGFIGAPGTQAAFAGTLSTGDRQFVTDLARLYELVVQLGNRAQSLGDHDAAKFYALQMSSEYAARQRELRELAGFQYPGSIDFGAAENAWRARVTGLTGSALDREYLRVMLEIHQATLTLQGRGVDSSILRDHVSDLLRRVEAHLKLARDTQSQL
jgi:hypothetical protein